MLLSPCQKGHGRAVCCAPFPTSPWIHSFLLAMVSSLPLNDIPKAQLLCQRGAPKCGGGGEGRSLRAPAFLLVRAVWRRRVKAMQPGCRPWEQRSCMWSMDAGAGAGQELSKRGSTRRVQEVPSHRRLFRGCFTCSLSFTNGMRGPGCAEPGARDGSLGKRKMGTHAATWLPPPHCPSPIQQAVHTAVGAPIYFCIKFHVMLPSHSSWPARAKLLEAAGALPLFHLPMPFAQGQRGH